MSFVRDFPMVASEYNVSEVYKWADDKEFDDENEERMHMNAAALMILRQYLTERVLSIVMVGQPKLAATVYRALDTIFLTNDSKTKVQVTRELYGCEMGLGESVVDFLARLNALVEESLAI